MRRNELLGLRWDDIDFDRRDPVASTVDLIAVGYELHETRGKTPNARRASTSTRPPSQLLAAWRAVAAQPKQAAVGIDTAGWMFTDGTGQPIHPHAISQAFERIARRAGVPVIRLHDLRHTHATLLIKAGVPVKVVSERLGHATAAFTIETYQHVLPGMQADAAHIFERSSRHDALLPATTSREKTRLKRRKKTA